MLLLIFAIVILAFLLAGAVAFVFCALIPPTRRYALSVALWFAVWGPCSVGLSFIAISGLFASSVFHNVGDVSRLRPLGWLYLGGSILFTVVIATVSAVLHQLLIKRLTLALFRLYAAAVSAGVGGVLGLSLGWWMLADNTMKRDGSPWALALITLPAILILVFSFGLTAYRNARLLRCRAPEAFTWITPEEYGVS